MKVLIITPAYNEEKALQLTIDSVVNQDFLPVEWIIVDDNSQDQTSNLARQAAIKHKWINYLKKEKKQNIGPGKAVMEAFYFGYDNKKVNDFDVVMKLDADIILPKNYISEIIKRMEGDKNIGICGGICLTNGVEERITNLDHVRGAIKCYRKQCFLEIGGLLKSMGWDTVDEHTARFFNWNVSVFIDLKVHHQRKTNFKYGYSKAGYINGKMLYSIRMDFFLMLTNVFKWSLRFPYIISGLSLFFGYLKAMFCFEEKIVSKDLGVFIRKYRYKKIREKFNF